MGADLRWLVLLLAAHACTDCANAPAPPAAVSSVSEAPAASAPPTTPPPSTSTEAALASRAPRAATAAIARCETALEWVARDATSVKDALAAFRRACAELHGEADCRAAWMQAAAEPPVRQAARLAHGCKPAYCTRLPEPRPALCTSEPAPGAALDAAWAELERAVWTYELGREAPRLQAALVRAFYEGGERWPVARDENTRRSERAVDRPR